jgi:AmmeMemoRadiSam system protein A
MPDTRVPVALAQESLRHYLKTGGIMPLPAGIPPELERRAGAFVSLKKQGRLRGCIGTFGPTQPNVAAEIIHNAVLAATEDPRFPPVAPGELDELAISVDILEKPERVAGMADLNPEQYGVIVRCGGRTGLLLPMLEGVDTVEEQVAIAMEKAGIQAGEKIELYRFTVTRYQ